MEAWQFHQQLSQGLSFNTKIRIRRLVPRYLMRVKLFQDSRSMYREALTQLKVEFPFAPPASFESMATYLIGVAASSEDTWQKLDTTSDLKELESLRLQMAMDRLSKLMSTLSNLLKKVSETGQGITQNIK